MEYRQLGKWGVRLSEIGIGSWMTELDGSDKVELATSTIRKAYESGVNFFDCADAYSGGQAEIFLGQTLKDYPREELVISSKVFFPTGSGTNDCGLSRKHIRAQIERSLKNMQLEYIDLYFCHRPDLQTPMEETLQMLSDLVEQGKILYYGVSEWSPVQLTKALGIIKEMRLRPLSVIQPQYNMMDRYIEDELMGICEENGIGIVPFSPLSQGLLTGKYRKGYPLPEGSRATHQADRQINNLLTEDNLDKVAALQQLADELSLPLAVMALAWLLRSNTVTSVIMGASVPEQFGINAAASGVKLNDDTLNKIEKILNYHPFSRHIG